MSLCRSPRLSADPPRADLAHVVAQPTMSGIGIESRMPEQRDRDLRHRDGQRKAHHPGAQVAGMALGNAGNQVGGPGERQRRGKAAYDGDDLAREPKRLKRAVDRSLVQAPSRYADVPDRKSV